MFFMSFNALRTHPQPALMGLLGFPAPTGDSAIARRRFVGTLAGCLLTLPFDAFAQQTARLPRIGALGNEENSPAWERFRRGLRELGYVVGRNVTIVSRWSEARTERFPALAVRIVTALIRPQ